MERLKIYITLFFLILISCSDNNLVVIKNQSNSEIDSIIVVGNSKCPSLNLKKINSDTVIYSKLSNCNEGNKSDGSISIRVFKNKKEIRVRQGYFTNGWIYFDKLTIVINQKDSVLTIFE